jgi:hypothetical protein
MRLFILIYFILPSYFILYRTPEQSPLALCLLQLSGHDDFVKYPLDHIFGCDVFGFRFIRQDNAVPQHI